MLPKPCKRDECPRGIFCCCKLFGWGFCFLLLFDSFKILIFCYSSTVICDLQFCVKSHFCAYVWSLWWCCVLFCLFVWPTLGLIFDLGPTITSRSTLFRDLVREMLLVFVNFHISVYKKQNKTKQNKKHKWFTSTCYRSPIRPELATSLISPRIFS